MIGWLCISLFSRCSSESVMGQGAVVTEQLLGLERLTSCSKIPKSYLLADSFHVQMKIIEAWGLILTSYLEQGTVFLQPSSSLHPTQDHTILRFTRTDGPIFSVLGLWLSYLSSRKTSLNLSQNVKDIKFHVFPGIQIRYGKNTMGNQLVVHSFNTEALLYIWMWITQIWMGHIIHSIATH